MGLLDAIKGMFALEPFQVRTEDTTDFATQLADIRSTIASPWRQPSVRDALAVPAIFRSVTLISNTVGGLAFQAWRNGTPIPQEDAPRVILRPNPFTTPREFYRETTWSLATMGEAWWWIAARDIDDQPLSLFPMPADEVMVELNERDLLRPKITWRNKLMRNEDVRQLVFARIPGKLRGEGPLQLCGAAVSASVEAQSWAANFFAQGGVPSVLIKSADALTEDEAKDLKAQWVEQPSNVPRVIDPAIEAVTDFGLNPEKAQLTESRRYSTGEAARMFGIPGSLLEFVESGSSLTYQNIAQVYDQFVRACLLPNYIEPIEQAMSDLLTRSTVARANTEGLLRAEVKTRYEVYASGITSGVLTVDEARSKEGLIPGDPELAPVPFASPQAIPASLPIQQRTDGVLRCVKCNRLLAEFVSPPYRFTCPKCKTIAEDSTVQQRDDGSDRLTAALLALATREQPVPTVNNYISPPAVTVEAPVTISEGAVTVSVPPPAPEPDTETIVARDKIGASDTAWAQTLTVG